MAKSCKVHLNYRSNVLLSAVGFLGKSFVDIDCHVEVVSTHVESEIRASTGLSLTSLEMDLGVGARDPVTPNLQGQYST